jgi:D-alanyl-D-alanine carboxypeptidase/D-alanyl-D-alanine-endopeptidase (penicillin-binding protein 4)
MLHRNRIGTHIKELLFLFVASIALSGSAAADLAGRIEKVVGKAKPGDYAIHIVEPGSAAVIYSHNPTKAMTPASNMKLITTAAALRYLGPLFEYRTRVGLCGSTLVVIGSGDPLLGDPVTDARYGRKDGWIFEQVARSLQAMGVESVADVVVDTTVFDDQRVHPNWLESDLNRWYACEVCGVNYRGNCIQVTTSNSRPVPGPRGSVRCGHRAAGGGLRFSPGRASGPRRHPRQRSPCGEGL